MNLDAIIEAFSRNAKVFEEMLQEVPIAEREFKSLPKNWSLLEIVNHLLDEEREDFRIRVDLTLHAPDKTWPSIDPETWVGERLYAARDYNESLESFLAERERSVDWLSTLENPDWQSSHEHRSLGRMTAGDLLASWLAHDFLHMNQILRVKLDYQRDAMKPYRTEYASG